MIASRYRKVGMFLIVAAIVGSPNDWAQADYGPRSALKDVRNYEQSIFATACQNGSSVCQSDPRYVQAVTVVARYALVNCKDKRNTLEWQELLTIHSGHWVRISPGGNPMDVVALKAYGVPQRIAAELVTHNAKSAAVQRAYEQSIEPPYRAPLAP